MSSAKRAVQAGARRSEPRAEDLGGRWARDWSWDIWSGGDPPGRRLFIKSATPVQSFGNFRIRLKSTPGLLSFPGWGLQDRENVMGPPAGDTLGNMSGGGCLPHRPPFASQSSAPLRGSNPRASRDTCYLAGGLRRNQKPPRTRHTHTIISSTTRLNGVRCSATVSNRCLARHFFRPCPATVLGVEWT